MSMKGKFYSLDNLYLKKSGKPFVYCALKNTFIDIYQQPNLSGMYI